MDAKATRRNDEEAARWVVRLEAGALSDAEQRQFDAWLEASPAHRGALIRARAAWTDLDRLGTLAGKSAPHDPDSSLVFHRRYLLAASVAALALIAGAYFALTLNREVYESGIGEVRRVTLADGSSLVLNTATRAVVRFNEEKREVRLERGEALFQVHKDSARPFIVRTDELTVKAVGTAFAVRVANERTAVTVTEGVVEIARPEAESLARRGDARRNDQPQRVTANHRAIVAKAETKAAVPPPITIELIEPEIAERQLAWRGGMVAFDGEPLREAVNEINRHSHRQIVIDDAELAARPIVGIFSANDIEGFAQTAAAALGAEAHEQGDTIHLTTRQGVGEN